ncbi:hypothetical protein QBC33DRAFT_516042 [Phialemonium atrogriseum]|uniref:BZIP domain-containing protein n=1 Tax=Phialemonium atrogriseum TaxID=1093897 RepID=A0AAJ0BX65_9PEZI|nr:uncharacterized protein QBC33DRAFT_516042 [Phialemonium atrogriseum]KAK1766133.1 hypothetical protein QBC33DRAFT_516042 [Phialemonium atrogriseum]
MDSPSHFFNDCLGLSDGDSYPGTFDNDRAAAYDQHRVKLYNDKLLIGDSPLSRTPKSQVPRSSMWGRIHTTDMEGAVPDTQPLYIDPSLYSANDSITALPLQAEESSATPESQPSMRRPSSTNSDFRRASKSGSSLTDLTPPDNPPPKKRKPRKTKRAANMPKDEEKRVKFLERNRIAASKCREKKKQFVSELEDTKIDLEAQHAQLQLEYNSLLSEVSGLKHRLMAHAKCNDPNIDSWLSNEARRFVQTTTDLFGPYQGPSSHSSHTRNHSTASSRQSVSFNPLDTGDRRDSIAYSQASPTDMVFPPIGSPKLKTEMSMNYDHMPDNLFNSEQ